MKAGGAKPPAFSMRAGNELAVWDFGNCGRIGEFPLLLPASGLIVQPTLESMARTSGRRTPWVTDACIFGFCWLAAIYRIAPPRTLKNKKPADLAGLDVR